MYQATNLSHAEALAMVAAVQRQAESEKEMDGQQRQRLTGDRDGADQHQAAQADAVERGARLGRRGHGGDCHVRMPFLRLGHDAATGWPTAQRCAI